MYTTRLGRGHIILVPTPEAVFSVFYTMRERMILGVFSSLSLLLIGFGVSLPLGVALGLVAGWNSRLRDTVVPIARVLSPIPAIIYAPYLIAIMPSFRSASAMVLIIGILWPTFLQMAARVGALDQRILDSARVLGAETARAVMGGAPAVGHARYTHRPARLALLGLYAADAR